MILLLLFKVGTNLSTSMNLTVKEQSSQVEEQGQSDMVTLPGTPIDWTHVRMCFHTLQSL